MGKPDVDDIEIDAGEKALIHKYGYVIGDMQARNIAYTVLSAARVDKFKFEELDRPDHYDAVEN